MKYAARRSLLARHVALLLLSLLFLVHGLSLAACSAPEDNADLPDPEQPEAATQKVTYHYYSDNTTHTTDDADAFFENAATENGLQVIITLNYTVPACDCKERAGQAATKQEADAIRHDHSVKLKELHSAQNNAFVADCGLSSLPGEPKLMVAEYSPSVSLTFDSLDAYRLAESQILACADHTAVAYVLVEPLELNESNTDN